MLLYIYHINKYIKITLNLVITIVTEHNIENVIYIQTRTHTHTRK